MAEPDYEIARWYTAGRRFPRLIGKTSDGTKLPGGPYTIHQLVVLVGLLWVGYQTMGIWGHFGVMLNLAVLFGVPFGAAFIVGKLGIISANPLNVAVGVADALKAPFYGEVAGKSVDLAKTSKPKGRGRLLIVATAPRGLDSGNSRPTAPPLKEPRELHAHAPAQQLPPLTGIQQLLASSGKKDAR